MQLAHRRVEDRLQAWLLAELIRYLEHSRSGAAGFDDMGMAWVPIREAVAANTPRTTDRKISAITTSWEKLIRHLSPQMTSQLGHEGERSGGREALPSERKHTRSHQTPPDTTRSRKAEWRR